MPDVSPEDLKREAKEAIGAAVEYSKQDGNELVNEAHKDMDALCDDQ